MLAWSVSQRQQGTVTRSEEPVLPAGVATVLSVLRSSAVVVDDDDEVVKASAPAIALGLVRSQRLASTELAELVRLVRRDGQIREVAEDRVELVVEGFAHGSHRKRAR